MKSVVVFSDGGCRGNPGPGAWAVVLEYKGRRKELSGGEPATTNNRMELQGAIAALNALREPCEVAFYTDSKYVKDGITSWVRGWKAKGWRISSKKPLKNADLWKALDQAVARHRVTWHWVKGHAGHPGNERCDQLANTVMDRIQASHSRAQLAAALKAFVASTNPPGERETTPLFSGG